MALSNRVILPKVLYGNTMRYLVRSLLSLLILALNAGCALRVQQGSSEFDKVCGKGPVLIVPTDETAFSTTFFRQHWSTSATIKHLVTQRGTPEAISLEREFLRPNRLKLYYPAQGQVYLLDQVGGEWLVAGSEPLERAELELVVAQRDKLGIMAVTPPVVRVGGAEVIKEERAPVAAVSSAEFRGMLRPPGAAASATLAKGSNGSYLHTVTFPREDLFVLADWYTEDSSNARLLAQSNKRSVQKALTIGERIAIPRSIMRNATPLPEAMVP